MPINLQGSGNIAEGWGAPPKLDAPNIGGVLGEILQQRRWQQAQTQKNIADTIKNIQSQREEQVYTDALQKAGLLPEGDYGGLGIKGGTSLAAMIQRKQALDALTAHRTAMEARIGGRGHGGGGGGGGSAEPNTVWKDGIEWRPCPGGRWIPMKPAAGTKADVPKLSPTEKGWAAPEIPELSVDINAPSDAPASVLPPDIPPMPDQAPQTGAPPADTAAGHAQDYGTTGSDDTSGVRVKVISPDGKVGTLPASQLQDALVMGYKQVP